MAKLDKRQSRRSRHTRIRARVSGTQERPRLCVFRSLNHVYAQLIDDAAGHTLAAASTLCQEVVKDSKDASKHTAAQKVGSQIGKLAMERGIKQVVFDRAGYRYHGRVKALAEAARQAGLKF